MLNPAATPFEPEIPYTLLRPKSQIHSSKIAQTKANLCDSEELTWNSLPSLLDV